MIAVSSGSTGEPTVWPRSLTDELAVAARFEQVFSGSFAAEERRTLAVVCFPMGTWVGGLYTLACTRHLAAKGYPITVVAPGNNKAEILRVIPELAAHVDQIVLLGYPPFLKDVIDTGIAAGVGWPRYPVRLVLAGEVFSEEWRDLVGQRAGTLVAVVHRPRIQGSLDGGDKQGWTGGVPPPGFLSGVGVRLPTSYHYTPEVAMPTRTDSWPTGTPCWIDLAVPDVAAATEFYAAVLGWTFADAGEEYGHYQVCQRNGRAAAGISPCQNEGQPTIWTTYLASDAVDATAKMITESGGTLLAEPFDVPGSGRLCIALDPQGASFGVWQAAGSIGVEIYNEPGALVWSEAALPDAEAGRRFYATVFDYTYQPVDGAGPDYLTFHRGGDPLGGIGGMQDSPPGAQPHWMAYFMVTDTDAAVAAATGREAAVLGEPVDTPYGRMAVITDPQGATFALMGAVPAG